MKIVLATDGSAYSRIAEELILKAPKWREAEIVVASVADIPTMAIAGTQPGTEAVLADELQVIQRTAKEHAEHVVSETAGRLRSAGVNARESVVEGEAPAELLNVVENEAADMIAVGSRGEGAVKAFFLGSVARRMLAYSPVSVLIGRTFKDTSAEDTVQRLQGLEKLDVLVCVDGSEGSRLALEAFTSQGAAAFEDGYAVCAEPLSVLPPGVDPAAFGATYRYDHERAEAIAKAACQELAKCSEHCIGETVLGKPAEVLMEAAARRSVHLMGLGATRHGFIERFLIGSVSHEIATEAGCSVFVARKNHS